jgi:hypothetical protein
MSEQITEAEWKRRYAARLMEHGGMPEAPAVQRGESAYEVAMEDYRAFPGCGIADPEGMADEEMSCWEDDALDRPALAAVPVPSPSSHMVGMVNRFLSWPLPKTFSPDCGISFKPEPTPCCWPTGTNLFTATEAREMLEHVTAIEGAVPAAVPATLPESMSRDEMLSYYSEYANMVANEVIGYQKQIRDLKAAIAASAVPADHRELMLLAAFDLESWMNANGLDGATEDTVKRLREAALATSAPSPVEAGEPTELEMFHADHAAIQAAGFHDAGELLAAYKHMVEGVEEYTSIRDATHPKKPTEARGPSDAQITVALRAACLHDTPESRKDMRAALIAAAALRAEQPSAGDGWTPIGTAPKEPSALDDTQAELDAVTREMDVIYERWPGKDDRLKREELLTPLRARCVEIGRRRYRIVAALATSAPPPIEAGEPTYFCNKCGYGGSVQVGHQRPNGTGECGYMAVLFATP